MTKIAMLDGPLTIAYCDTRSEHEDNARFKADCERWFGQEVITLASDEYLDTWDVWERRRFISGPDGAPCTGLLKVEPRLKFQRPDDIHLFGYTNDKSDILRAKKIRENHFDLTIRTPLIERGLDKAACLALLQGAGIKEPVTYEMGFPNANCLPCGKATSPSYWALYRKHFPHGFARMAELSRRLGARLTRINDERIFIDEIPENWPVTQPILPTCDLLCGAQLKELTHDHH
jgi:hypothetical protein